MSGTWTDPWTGELHTITYVPKRRGPTEETKVRTGLTKGEAGWKFSPDPMTVIGANGQQATKDAAKRAAERAAGTPVKTEERLSGFLPGDLVRAKAEFDWSSSIPKGATWRLVKLLNENCWATERQWGDPQGAKGVLSEKYFERVPE